MVWHRPILLSRRVGRGAARSTTYWTLLLTC